MICDLVGCDMRKMSSVMNQIVNEIIEAKKEQDETKERATKSQPPICITKEIKSPYILL